jgi:nicotinamide-nucleotide amidase
VSASPATAPLRVAAIVATGEELVRGSTVDTNSAWIARRLRAAGVPILRITVVGDGLDAIRDAVLASAREADLLVVTGGLGPTPDDRTRDALAAAANVPLERDADAAAQLSEWFARLGRTPSESNARQALLPRGARAIRNQRGSAPGIDLTLGRARVVAVPGVPGEMRAMVDEAVMPLVRAAGATPVVERWLQVCGLPESVLGERIGAWMRRTEPPLVSDTVSHGVITVCASDRDDTDGRKRLDACIAAMRAALGDHVFSDRDESLAERIVADLRARRATLALAESCTGGMIAAAITDVPGSSEALLEACVTYANESKSRTLGVPEELLREHGAVSDPVARAMAEGIRRRANATFGVATTGIAGPTGGTPEKPVGLVHLAVATPTTTIHARRLYPGDRDSIRRFAVTGALDLLRRNLQ